MSQDNYLNLERLKQFFDKLKTVFVSKDEIRNRDSADNTITFASSDTADPSAWTDVAVLKSGESHKSLAQKASAMFKNVRYLRKLYEALTPDDIGAFPGVTIVTEADTDLNDYTESGIYFFAVSKAPVNRPAGSNGWLMVLSSERDTWIKQIWLRLGNTNSTDHETYVRTNNTSWSDWQQFITSTGGTMTGNLILNKQLILSDTVHNATVLTVYDDGDGADNFGSEVVIGANGNTFIGSGESAPHLRTELIAGNNIGEAYTRAGEHMYISSDGHIYVLPNCQTVAARKGYVFDNAGHFKPLPDNVSDLGSEAQRFKDAYFAGTVTAENFSGNAASASKLQSARTIDGVSFDGSGSIKHYATCSTAAATAAKVVALTGFVLNIGAEVTVKFTATNTAANPTLNVNNTGAKAIQYNGTAIAASNLRANMMLKFVYDGTYWILVGWVDTNTKYTNMTGASSSAAGKAGLVPAPAAGAQGKYLRGDGTWQTPPDTDTKYTHPTTAGNKHIPSGGANRQILQWLSDGTAKWGYANDVINGSVLYPNRILPSAYVYSALTDSCQTPQYVQGDDDFTIYTRSGIINATGVFGDPFELYLTTSENEYIQNNTPYYSFAPSGFIFSGYSCQSNGEVYTANLGSPTYHWNQLYADSGTIQTSDRNKKENINLISDKYIEFFKLLHPVSFQFIDGTSGRTHIGFIAQDVEDAMNKAGLTDLEFAGFCKDIKKERILDENGKPNKYVDVLDEDGKPVYIYSLRYEEFIALTVKMVQMLYSLCHKQEEKIQEQDKTAQKQAETIQHLSERLEAIERCLNLV